MSLTPTEVAQLVAVMSPDARGYVDALGLSPAMRLFATLGGTRLYIPAQIPRRHRIVEAIGRDAAQAAARRYGGEHVEVPTIASVRRLLRGNAARAMFDSGLPLNEVSRRMGLSSRHARKLMRSPGGGPTPPAECFAADPLITWLLSELCGADNVPHAMQAT